MIFFPERADIKQTLKYWNCIVSTQAVIISTRTVDIHERREHSSLDPLLYVQTRKQEGIYVQMYLESEALSLFCSSTNEEVLELERER